MNNNSSKLPRHICNKFVPRTITEPKKIIRGIEAVISHYVNRFHAEAGSLITAETLKAWENLKLHVEKGCLCDPHGLQLHAFSNKGSQIGGEMFYPLQIFRGSSALEGFHSHQKEWLGLRAQHCKESGEALLMEGAVRWNRKRRQQGGHDALPTVFSNGVLQEIDALHLRLKGSRLYLGLTSDDCQGY